MTGIKMDYNLKTKDSECSKVVQKLMMDTTQGAKFAMKLKECFIKNSTYTTCESDTPSFSFESKKMKIVQTIL